VNSAGATSFAGAVGGTTALASLTTDAGGTVSLAGVTTTGAQKYNDAGGASLSGSFTGSSVSVAGPATLTDNTSVSAATVSFAGAIDGAKNLSIAASAAANFGGALGATTALADFSVSAPTLALPSVTATGSVTLTSSGTVTQTGAIKAARLAVSAGDTVTLVNAGNDVGSFAAKVTGAGHTLAFVDADGFEVGSVGALSGVSTVNADASLRAATGNLTTTQAINVGAANLFLGASTGSVDAAGLVTASGLAIEAAGNSRIQNASFTTLGANMTGSGTLRVTDSSGFIVDRVDVTTALGTQTVVGLTAHGGDVALVASSGDIEIGRPVAFGSGDLLLSAEAGQISQLAPITGSGGLAVLSKGDVILTDIANDVGGFAGKASDTTSKIVYYDATGLSLNAITVATLDPAGAPDTTNTIDYLNASILEIKATGGALTSNGSASITSKNASFAAGSTINLANLSLGNTSFANLGTPKTGNTLDNVTFSPDAEVVVDNMQSIIVTHGSLPPPTLFRTTVQTLVVYGVTPILPDELPDPTASVIGALNTIIEAKEEEETRGKGIETPSQLAFSVRTNRPNYAADVFQHRYDVVGIGEEGRATFEDLSYVADGFWEGLLK
jgi:hypothetical protein